MAEHKRALVVDDSKSARLVLRRMLEKRGIIVDTVESASMALDFLTRNRPDVIFLDHMMPGMDGFEAIKAIKDNPDTATIPVMMYTSKGGDLYLGQARALGAVGVLPKTVAPAELFDTLQRLGLIAERRSTERRGDEDNGASERAEDILQQSAVAQPFLEPGMQRSPVAADSDSLDIQLRKLLDEQRVEIRKDMLMSIETVSRQTGSRIARELDEKISSAPPATTPASGANPLALVVLGVLLLVSLAWNFFAPRTPAEPVIAAHPAQASQQQTEQLRGDLKTLQETQDDIRRQLRNSWQTTGWALNQSLYFDYDEIALDDGRIAVIEQLLAQLRDGGYSGKIILETRVGEFCLLGDQQQGFRLPPPDLPVGQCEFIGNPVQAADTPAAHQSLRFANFLASTPLLEAAAYQLELVAVSRADPIQRYPALDEQTTAAEWNRAAAANNRVIIRLEPA